MKVLITEQQSLMLKYRRRIDELISHLKDTYSYNNPCEYFDVDSSFLVIGLIVRWEKLTDIFLGLLDYWIRGLVDYIPAYLLIC